MTDTGKVLFILSLLAYSSLRVSGRYAPPLKKSSHIEPGISPPVLHNNQLSSSLQGRGGEASEVDNGEDLARRAALMAALKALKEIDDLYAFKTRPRFGKRSPISRFGKRDSYNVPTSSNYAGAPWETDTHDSEMFL